MMRLHDKKHLLNALTQDARYDGRKKTDYRKITIETGLLSTAEGSAKIQIGDTMVLAGVKLAVEKPYSDTPDVGSLMVNAEFLPLASNDFETGPPGIDSIELARVIDRSIREGHAMDTKKLCIKAGEAVWNVMVDICVLNYDGNLFDAASLAVISAIKDAKLPLVDDDNNIDYHVKIDVSVPLDHEPISVTVCKIGDQIFIDPTAVEYDALDARLTVGVVEDGNLCALQKGGAPLTIEESVAMIALGVKKVKELRKHL